MTIVKGYKATDENMSCRDVQFVLGEWQEVKGELIECQNGFHFCTQLAHTYEFYSTDTDRRFECEVVDVLDIEEEPGVRMKRVCRKIRLTKELTTTGDKNTGDKNTGDSNTGNRNTGNSNTGNRNTGDRNTGNRNTGNRNTGDSNTGNSNIGDSNTGDRNTGHRNTGDRNTGDRNTGYKNTGYSNTGDSNTGYSNTGDRNTGYWNTGNWNTGYWNTGNRNTGDSNTGYSNTGDRNTGNWNTGNWNHCNYSTGFFGSIDPKVTSFDLPTDYSHTEFQKNFSKLIDRLGELLLSDNPIDVTPFLEIPNITQENLNNLHQKFIKFRQEN